MASRQRVTGGQCCPALDITLHIVIRKTANLRRGRMQMRIGSISDTNHRPVKRLHLYTVKLALLALWLPRFAWNRAEFTFAMALTLVFYFPSLIDASVNAGFIYTGDVLGFYWPAMLKT